MVAYEPQALTLVRPDPHPALSGRKSGKSSEPLSVKKSYLALVRPFFLLVIMLYIRRYLTSTA
jgi:hypothetical protein